MRTVLIPMFAVVLGALGAGCGGGDDDGSRAFTFTPYPYTVISLGGTAVPLSTLDNGNIFHAERVVLVVEKDESDRIAADAMLSGFEFERSIADMDDREVIVLTVPLGSTLAAVEELKDWRGVHDAHLNYYFQSQDEAE